MVLIKIRRLMKKYLIFGIIAFFILSTFPKYKLAAEDGLNEISSLTATTSYPKKSRGSNNEVLGAEMLSQVLSRQLRFTIEVGWNRSIKLSIAGGVKLALSTKDIIGADINQLCPELVSGNSHVPNP